MINLKTIPTLLRRNKLATPNYRTFNSGIANSAHGLSCCAGMLTLFAGWHKCSFFTDTSVASLSGLELKGRFAPSAVPPLSWQTISLLLKKHISSACVEATLYPEIVVDLLTHTQEMSLRWGTCCAVSGTNQINSQCLGGDPKQSTQSPRSAVTPS